MIVAFTGKKGHGKDTAAQCLMLQGSFRHKNFAEPVKIVCHTMYGLQPEEMHDPILKEKTLERWPHKTPRHLMQEVAQFARDKYPEIWVVNWIRRVDAPLKEGLDIVCTDLRYLNEEEVVRELGGLIIKIVRPVVQDNEFSQHKSETELDGIRPDYTFINDRTPAELHADVLRVVNARRAQS
jgi:hypothetical protein